MAKQVLKGRGKGVAKEGAGYVLQARKTISDQSQSLASTFSILAQYWIVRLDEHLEMVQVIRQDAALLSRLGQVAAVLVKTFQEGGKLLICGNGGSAADAQHIAGELVSRFFLERPGLHAEALTANVASMTAIANDYAYEKVFARQVEAKGARGDVLIGISTSGRSKNVVRAMEVARAKGMTAVALTGNKQGAEIVRVADYCLHMPSSSTPRIQEAHLLLGHMLCEFIEHHLFGEPIVPQG